MARRYSMFISYRHADNVEMGRKWATWLHESVENYEIPGDLIGGQNLRGEPVPQTLYPVFRDEDELPADSDLSNNIRRALENSSMLVVICSPRAVESRFVADEIRYFKEIGRGDRILALIIDGEPNASDHPASSAAECFPEPLRHGVTDENGNVDWSARAEPIAADCRPGGTPTQGWTTAAAYKEWLETQPDMDRQERQRAMREYGERLELAKLKVIAGALGVPLGELTQRDKVRQLQRARRRARVLTSLSSLFALLAAAAGVLGWMANERRQEAEAQRREANHQREQAETRRIEAEAAKTLADEEKRRAVATLAISDFQEGANRLADPNTARSGLAYLARSARNGNEAAATRIWTLFQQRSFWLPSTADKEPPSPAGTRMRRSPVPREFRTVNLLGERVAPTWYAESGDGQRCVTVVSTVDAGVGPTTFRVWETNGQPLGPWREVNFDGMHYLYEISSAVLSDDGRFLAVVAQPWRESQYIELWDVDGGRRIGEPIIASGGHPNDQGGRFEDIWFTPHVKGRIGPQLVTLSNRGNAALHQLDADEEEPSIWELALNDHAQPVTMAGLAHGLFISHSIDGSVQVCSANDGAAIGWPATAGTGASGMRIDAPDRFSLRLRDGTARSWRLLSPARLPVPKPTDLPGASKPGLHKDWENEGRAGLRAADELDDLKLWITQDNDVRLTNAAGDKPIWQRNFPAAVAHARLLDPDTVMIQTEFFTTEIWDVTEDRPKHPPIDESALFSPGGASDTVLLSSLTPDHRHMLTRSFRWIPPNLGIYAFTVWDTATGKPLSDRTLHTDDAAGDGDSPSPNHAEFSGDGQFLYYGFYSSKQEKTKASSSLQLIPPPRIAALVPDLAEALGGLRLLDDGSLTPADGSSAEVIASVLKTLSPE